MQPTWTPAVTWVKKKEAKPVDLSLTQYLVFFYDVELIEKKKFQLKSETPHIYIQASLKYITQNLKYKFAYKSSIFEGKILQSST